MTTLPHERLERVCGNCEWHWIEFPYNDSRCPKCRSRRVKLANPAATPWDAAVVEIIQREDGDVVGRITVERQPWMDDGDMTGETTEKVVEWASRNGYSYDDLDWDYL